jgi:hypothetical protein
VVAQLEARRDALDRDAITAPDNKGPSLVYNMEERSFLDNLIYRIDTGQPVSQAEIDAALSL